MALPGEVGFAGHYPGKIQVFDLAPGQVIMVQRDGFLFAQSTVTLDIAMVKRLGAGLLGGEGFILQKLVGPGLVFIHAGGDHVDYNLAPGETLQVQTGHLVAFEPSVNYDIQMVGNIRTAIFGGEGLFLTTLTGPGRVILQSMTLERLRHELAPAEHRGAGQEMSNPLGRAGQRQSGSVFRLGRIGAIRSSSTHSLSISARQRSQKRWFAVFFCCVGVQLVPWLDLRAIVDGLRNGKRDRLGVASRQSSRSCRRS